MPAPADGIIFLKKMLEETKTSAEPKAHRRPNELEGDKSKVHASMTPRVRGRREMYICVEYDTPNRIA